VRLIALDKADVRRNLAICGRRDNDTYLAKGNLRCAWMNDLFQKHQIKQVVHFAAESHVDRSLLDSGRLFKPMCGTQSCSMSRGQTTPSDSCSEHR